MMRNRITPTLILAATLTTPTASAAAQTDDADPLPACTKTTDLGCTSTVTNIRAGDNFCQLVDTLPAVCHPFWPFRNPTVNTHAAMGDQDALPGDYSVLRNMVADQAAWGDRLVAELVALDRRLERRGDRIVRMHRRIEGLRDRLRH